VNESFDHPRLAIIYFVTHPRTIQTLGFTVQYSVMTIRKPRTLTPDPLPPVHTFNWSGPTRLKASAARHKSKPFASPPFLLQNVRTADTNP
jgi:hypothetical protein